MFEFIHSKLVQQSISKLPNQKQTNLSILCCRNDQFITVAIYNSNKKLSKFFNRKYNYTIKTQIMKPNAILQNTSNQKLVVNIKLCLNEKLTNFILLNYHNKSITSNTLWKHKYIFHCIYLKKSLDLIIKSKDQSCEC